MKHHKKTKIVSTLGPQLFRNKALLKEMIISGVNVFRINFSHADYDAARDCVALIRELNEELDFNVAILSDLQGPKLRVGVMQEGIELAEGDVFKFTTVESEGTKESAFMTYSQFPKDVKVGEHILVDDGKLLFEVTDTNGTDLVTTKVLRGGPLKSKKGVNLPNTDISLPALTEKDVNDAIFALTELKTDWIALSFVRNPADLDDIHKLIAEHTNIEEYRTRVISKIEKPEALENIDAIIANTDALMVARGDLGVEIPMAEVPLAQKMLVEKSKKARIPVVIATQMIETMIDNSVPTRAEVNDIANSIMDGADAVMVSGETSVGKFPVEVIKTLRSIIESVEHSELITVPRTAPVETDPERKISAAVCHQAAMLAEEIEAKAVCTLTNSGYTAFQVSAWRPKSSILAYSTNKRVLAMMNLLWGVKGRYYAEQKTSRTSEAIKHVNDAAKASGYVESGDIVVNLNATPVIEAGKVNTLRVSEIV